jgi:UDP-glucuronate decarboxylase
MDKLAEVIYSDAIAIAQKIDWDELSNKSIVLTGASGLIGVYFLACLKYASYQAKSPFKLYAIMQAQPMDYMKDFLDYFGANVLKGDITNNDFIKTIPQADYIIHAAGYGQPGRFMEDQVKTLKLNTASTFQLFDKLNLDGKFLFVSTSEVYSGLNNPPFKEDQVGTTNTTHNRSCYIEAKRCGEAICNAYRNRGVNAKSARLSLAYGPGTRPGDKRVLNAFIERALQGKLVMQDMGKAKRTYCYVSDAVEIMWEILLNGNSSIYNVGGHSRTTIKELAEKISFYLKVPLQFPNDNNELVGAPEDVYLDMKKVKDEFNKIDFISFEEGLSKTIEWQKMLYKNK